MTDADRNLAFAEVVNRALGGLPQREVRRRTGISATYVGDMMWGTVPSFRKLDQLVRGLELRGHIVRELFLAAGYAPPPDLIEEVAVEPQDVSSIPESGAEILWEGVCALQQRYELPEIPIPAEALACGGLANLTPDQARQTLKTIEERIKLSLDRRTNADPETA